LKAHNAQIQIRENTNVESDDQHLQRKQPLRRRLQLRELLLRLPDGRLHVPTAQLPVQLRFKVIVAS
jgi:hypothetical protein